MIARAERAELTHAALDRLARDGLGVGAGNRARGLDGFQIFARAVPAPHRPARAVRHHAAELAGVEADGAAATDAGGTGRAERLHERGQPGRHLGTLEARAQEPHATVDVEADRARAH